MTGWWRGQVGNSPSQTRPKLKGQVLFAHSGCNRLSRLDIYAPKYYSLLKQAVRLWGREWARGYRQKPQPWMTWTAAISWLPLTLLVCSDTDVATTVRMRGSDEGQPDSPPLPTPQMCTEGSGVFSKQIQGLRVFTKQSKLDVVTYSHNFMLRRLRQENPHEFETSLSYTISFRLAWSTAWFPFPNKTRQSNSGWGRVLDNFINKAGFKERSIP